MPFCTNCGIERENLDTPCSICGKTAGTQMPAEQAAPKKASEAKTPRAKIKRKRKTSAAGILLELIGLILLFLFPVGTLIGIILLVVGGRQSLKLICSACGNPVDSKAVKICPVCKSQFGKA